MSCKNFVKMGFLIHFYRIITVVLFLLSQSRFGIEIKRINYPDGKNKQKLNFGMIGSVGCTRNFAPIK